MKNENLNEKIPFAYLLTFRAYASWLHGDARHSVDRQHNIINTPKIKPNEGLQQAMKASCNEDEFILNAAQRTTVLKSIIDTCQFIGWHLYACHVRSNHIHVVLQADKKPEKLLVSIKAYATRYLRRDHPELSLRKNFWSTHGSTRYIYKRELLYPAMQYVIEEQGNKMALYYDPIYDEWKVEAC